MSISILVVYMHVYVHLLHAYTSFCKLFVIIKKGEIVGLLVLMMFNKQFITNVVCLIFVFSYLL